ncbi:TolC family protein [soil metagenome]
MKLLMCSLLMSCFSISSQARADVMTVPDLIRIGISKSQELEAKAFEGESLRSASERLRLGENPVLSIELGRRDHPTGSANQFRTAIIQPLGFGRAGLLGKAADFNSQIADFEGKSMALRLRAKLYEDTYRYMAADEKAQHAEERVARFREMKKFLGSRSFVSPQKKAEALIVAAKIQILQKEFLHLRAERDVLWESLNAYFNLEARPKIKTGWFQRTKVLTFDALWISAKDRHPEVQIWQARIHRAEAEGAAAAKEKWRGLAVTGFYSGESGTDTERIYGLGLALPLPVFDSGSQLVRSAELEKQAATAKASFERRAAERDLRSATIQYATAREAVLSLPFTSIPSLETAMRDADQGFRRGQVDLLTYIEAENQHSDSLAVIFDAQAEFAHELANLSFMTADPDLLEER